MEQYIGNKLTKWGFKCFALCDSETAYMCHFELYTGMQANDAENAATHNVMLFVLWILS